MKKHCVYNILNTVISRKKVFLTNHFLLLSCWWISLTLCHCCVSAAPAMQKLYITCHICFFFVYSGVDGTKKISKFCAPAVILKKSATQWEC